jgi:hypothetical protein
MAFMRLAVHPRMELLCSVTSSFWGSVRLVPLGVCWTTTTRGVAGWKKGDGGTVLGVPFAPLVLDAPPLMANSSDENWCRPSGDDEEEVDDDSDERRRRRKFAERMRKTRPFQTRVSSQIPISKG